MPGKHGGNSYFISMTFEKRKKGVATPSFIQKQQV
jgi:hypothetical protein